MKTVTSTKLSKAGKVNDIASMIDEVTKHSFKTCHLKSDEEGATFEKVSKELTISITSDKGSCDAIHFSLARNVRSHLNSINYHGDIVTIDNKIKMKLLRSQPEKC